MCRNYFVTVQLIQIFKYWYILDSVNINKNISPVLMLSLYYVSWFVLQLQITMRL